jgi:hypothetical protein
MAANNMWRVSTDILGTWLRILLNLESMAGQGAYTYINSMQDLGTGTIRIFWRSGMVN